ncbi:MAG: GFA family protein [Hyphomicrobiaceae bacterium]
MQVDGACHCGDVKYEADVNPAHVVICHCTDCQALSGTAFRVVVATTAGSFRLLQGELTIYTKIGESGNPREQTFCGNCGSPIYSAPPGPQPKVVSLRIGIIRQRAHLVPSHQYWHRSSLPWLPSLPEIDKTATQPVFDERGGFVPD